MHSEMWLDLVPILHRACAHFAADRQNPSGIQHDVALQLAWHTTETSPSATGCVAVPLLGLRGSDESGIGMATQTKRQGAAFLLIRALLGSYRP